MAKLTAGDFQIISRIPVFRGLKAETVEYIVAPATAVALRPRKSIMRQDDPATAFFIVIDGWVKLYRTTPSGDDTVIEMITRGHSFAEAVAFTGNRYLATAEAVSGTRVARIPADHIVRCIRQSPDIALGMIASITQRMHLLVQQVEQLKALSGVQRVAEFLASLSLAEQGQCALALPYDKLLIAGQLGLTPNRYRVPSRGCDALASLSTRRMWRSRTLLGCVNSPTMIELRYAAHYGRCGRNRLGTLEFRVFRQSARAPAG